MHLINQSFLNLFHVILTPHVFRLLATTCIFVISNYKSFSQYTTIVDTTSNKDSAVIIAGKQYNKGGIHNFFWGNHYRKEWTTPVHVKEVIIDTIFGGLTPILKGGGRQTKTLRLQDSSGKQYVLRSINKTYTKALPDVFQKSFIEGVANDQVSIAHPYSSLTVPMLAEAAKVYHTNPQIVFLKGSDKLGEFRTEFQNNLYLLEERPAGFQGNTPNFGNAEDVDGTDKMLQKLREENDHLVDQKAFVRARLFDMFLSDWGRHEDQWRWATFKEEGNKIYRPIPRDRDQAFTKFDGILVAFGTRAAQLTYLQSVDYTIKDITGYNFQARHMDRLLANETTLATWDSIAKELQHALTDQIIEQSIHKLPYEVYNISGAGLIAKLKSRRDHLDVFAREYYHVLAKEVDVVGTEKKELFQVTGVDENHLSVSVYDLDSDNNPKATPLYSRTFSNDETKEVRIYGWDGKDEYKVNGPAVKKINVRLIGGPKKDSYNVSSTYNGKLKLYDNKNNQFTSTGNARLHLAEDSSVHVYNYNAYKKDFYGFKPGISYSNEDRLFIHFGYRIQKQHWRKEPLGAQHDFGVNYSITQKAFSAQYKATFYQAIGKWNLGVLLDYDGVRDAHFPGIGNNTVLFSDITNYYRYRDREVNAGLSLFRQFGLHHTLRFTGYYQNVKVLVNTNRYITVYHAPTDPTTFNADQFGGAKAEYNFETINDKLFPSKGIRFSTGVDFAQNLQQTDRYVTNFSGLFGFYVPVAPSLTLAVKAGAATLTGTPEFYQLNKLGGGNTLRGFLRYRLYGKSAFYNQNELQWNFNVKSYILSGKMGLLALLDNGRVWQPSEQSGKWYTGVGGGVMIAPFNKITLTATYAKSNESARLNVRVGRLF